MDMNWENTLSNKVLGMEESATLLMAKLGRELKEQGHKVISLSLGEPDFDTPQDIKNAAEEALAAGRTKYCPVSGELEFKKAIQKKLKEENGIDSKLSQIVVSNGAKQCIANVCISLINPDDEIILFAPYWVSYKAIADFVGAKSIELKAGVERDFKVSAKELEDAITDKTKLVIFSSPCNPSGSVFTKEELHEIAAIIEKNPHVFVLSDEIYEYINFSDAHFSIGSIPAIKDQVITVNGMSKGFSMTGWRLGYMVAPEPIASACEKVQGQFTSGACTFNQVAAAYALNSDKKSVFEMRDAFLERKKLVSKLLNEIPGFKSNDPKGAFYLFPDVSELFGKSYNGTVIKDADDLAILLLREAHVATVSGGAFGSPECLRLSYAASQEELTEALRRIKDLVLKIK